jgi:hypothetical protein
MERGVYRHQGIQGVVDFYVYHSSGALICKSQVAEKYADEAAECGICAWLDAVDPIPTEGVTAPPDAYPRPSEASLAA